MYSRDYVLRLIEQFGRTLVALRNRLLGRHHDQVDTSESIAEIARHAGLDLDIARRLDPPSLLLWLAPSEDVDASRLWLMAELLYLAALANPPGQRRGDLERAVAIWQRLPPDWKPSDDFATVRARISEARDLITEDQSARDLGR
jgi:hypothetical protein